MIEKLRAFGKTVLGEKRYELLITMAQDALFIGGVTIIVVISTKVISNLLPVGDSDFAFIRSFMIFCHEGSIVAGVLAVLCKSLKHLWHWLRT